jgi:uroporphyrinogen-III synthase
MPIDPPLAGRSVAITRPAGQAASLARAIAEAGGRALVFPVIEIAPVEDEAELAAACADLDRFHLAFFVSPNAVEQALAYVLPRRAWPARLAVATVGKGSEAALARAGFERVIAPAAGFDSEAVLALPEFQAAAVAGNDVLIFRGDGGRDLLGDTLEERGARVRYVTCYRRRIPAADPAPLVDAARRGGLDALVLTSSEGVANLRAMVAPADWPLLTAVPVVVPHPRIAAAARRAGFVTVLESGPGDAGVLAALEAHLGPPSVKMPG